MTNYIARKSVANIKNYNLTKIIISTTLIVFIIFVSFVCLEITYINKEIQAMKDYREMLTEHRLNKIEELMGLVE